MLKSFEVAAEIISWIAAPSARNSKPASRPPASWIAGADGQPRRIFAETIWGWGRLRNRPRTSYFRRIRSANRVLFRGGGFTAASTMRRLCILVFATLLVSTWFGASARAELKGASAPHIEWEVKNRFRLFRNEADFQRHVARIAATACSRPSSGSRARATAAAGRATRSSGCASTGPASCWNSATATASAKSILSPRDHRIGVTLAGTCRPTRLRLELRRRRRRRAADHRRLQRGGEAARALRPADIRERRHHPAGRHGATAGDARSRCATC